MPTHKNDHSQTLSLFERIKNKTTHVEPWRAAAGIAPHRDIIERRAHFLRIDERVEEAEWRQVARQARVVEQRDDAGERRRRRGRAADGDGAAGEEDAEFVGLRGDVGYSLGVTDNYDESSIDAERGKGTYAAAGVE